MNEWNDYLMPKKFKQLHKSQNRPRAEWQNVLLSHMSFLYTFEFKLFDLTATKDAFVVSDVMCIKLGWGHPTSL